MLDIDDFKLLNDNYGHDVGDKAIVHCVNVIRKALRNTDVLCRVGGEEFLVCIPQMGIKKAEKIAEEVQNNKDLELTAKNHSLTTKTSGFFSREEPNLALGWSFDVFNQIFQMETGETIGPIKSNNKIKNNFGRNYLSTFKLQ